MVVKDARCKRATRKRKDPVQVKGPTEVKGPIEVNLTPGTAVQNFSRTYFVLIHFQNNGATVKCSTLVLLQFQLTILCF